MSDKSFTVNVKPRGKKIRGLPQSIDVSPSDSTVELYKKLAGPSKFSVHRLRITKASDGTALPPAVEKKSKVSELGLSDGDTIAVKDLGPQVSWRNVFLIEYLGPILIHPLTLYVLHPYIYPSSIRTLPYISSLIPAASHPPPPPSGLQQLTCGLVMTHFIKRELETLFLHHFSAATMPVFNIFKNSGHYWGLSGVVLAYFSYAPWARISPTSLDAKQVSPYLTFFGVWLFIVGELLNLSTHISLASIRTKQNPTRRAIPQGIGFDLVTCPNYLFETIAWIGIWMVNRDWSTAAFLITAFVQMKLWANKKERRLRKEFPGEYKKKRGTIIPYLL